MAGGNIYRWCLLPALCGIHCSPLPTPAIIASPPALCFPSDKSASLPACAEGAHVCVSASCKKHVPFRVDAGRASTTAPCCFCLPFPPPGGENWQPQIQALWQLLCDVGRGAYVGVCVCKVRYLSWAYTALQRCAVCQQRQDGSLVLPIEQVQRSPSQRVNKECHAPREASATCPPRRSPSQPTAAWSVGRISRWPSLAPPSGGEPLRFPLMVLSIFSGMRGEIQCTSPAVRQGLQQASRSPPWRHGACGGRLGRRV